LQAKPLADPLQIVGLLAQKLIDPPYQGSCLPALCTADAIRRSIERGSRPRFIVGEDDPVNHAWLGLGRQRQHTVR